MKPAAPYDPEHRPRPGSRITLTPNKPDGRPVPAILEGYLPGRVRGMPINGPRGHRNILVRVASTAIKTTTLQIATVTWFAPVSNVPKKRAKADAARRADTEAEITAKLPDPDTGSFWEFCDMTSSPARQTVLALWSADLEDENGDLPADTPPWPGLEGLLQLCVSERLQGMPRPRPRSFYRQSRQP